MPAKKKNNDVLVNSSFSENALKMLKKRYLLIDDKGHQETPADMFRRVAKTLAQVEKNYKHDSRFVKKVEKDFYDILSTQDFTPAGRTLANAGAGTSLVANCIVLPVKDSMEGIFQTLKEAALLQQAGSGLGFSFDTLRPAMSMTKRSRGTSSGPVSFLRTYNEAFRTIKQQGRHGANMAMMSIEHPDVLDFIRAKEVEGEFNCFNISVKVTDEFMKQLIENPDSQWYCTWKGEKVKPQKVLRYANGTVYAVEELDMTVRQMFDEIVSYAWLNGEPGIVFIDTVNETNPLPDMGRIECSNPCGEQFLHPYDNCNLGSLNLAGLVKKGEIDYNRLEFVTRTSTRMLDDVIDLFDFPVPQVTELAQKNRRIGLGIMGFADMLFQLGVAYNSPEGFRVAEEIMGFITDTAHKESQLLAKEKGVFSNWKESVWGKENVRLRNLALTTVAPTGSISMMFEASSGIEPQFALSYIKQDKDAVQYAYLNKYFEEELKRRKFDDDKIEVIKKEITETGTIQHLVDLPEDLRKTFVTAMDISGIDHIKMQAAFQRKVDNSISKTINLPNSATKEDVKESFVLAWRLKCKSCTVYRDGSRNIQVLNIGGSENVVSMTGAPVKKLGEAPMNLEVDKGRLTPRVRPATLVGRTYKVKTAYGNLYVTVNDDENGVPFEVFATIGKVGGFYSEQSDAISRLISLALRSGVKVEEVINQIKGIRGPMVMMTEKGTILSLPDAIGKILEEHVQSKNVYEEVPTPVLSGVEASSGSLSQPKNIANFGFMPECPDCGGELKMAEGCISCPSCGYSRCF